MSRLSPEFPTQQQAGSVGLFSPARLRDQRGECALTEPERLQNAAPHHKPGIHAEDFGSRSSTGFYRHLSHRCAGHSK